MAAAKYDRYFTTDCVKEARDHPGFFMTSTRPLETFGGGELSVDFGFVRHAHMMLTKPHRHEFAQYLNFFSSNPEDARDFDAEIELSLGDEQEKHVITCPTSVYVAPGLMHGPLNFKRIGRPVVFVDIAATGKYSRVGETTD